jgi:hypothetical protein
VRIANVSDLTELLTSQQAAALLGITRAGLNERRRDGKLKAIGMIGPSYVFSRADVLAQPRGAGRRGPKPGTPKPGTRR